MKKSTFVLIVLFGIQVQTSTAQGKMPYEEAMRAEKIANEFNERRRLHPELNPMYAPKKARDAGNFTEAERLYKQIKPGGLDYYEAQFTLAQIYDWQGKCKQAIQAYQNIMPTEKTTDSWGSDPRTLYGFASVRARAGMWRDAVNLYEFGLKRYLHSMGDSDMSQIVHFDPEVVETNHLVAWTDYLRGRSVYPDPGYVRDESLRHLRRAVKLKPNFTAAQETLGQALWSYPETKAEAKIHFAYAARYSSDAAEKERLEEKAGLIIRGTNNIITTNKNRKVHVRVEKYVKRIHNPELEAIIKRP